MGEHQDQPERHEFSAQLGTTAGAGSAAVIEVAQQAVEPKILDRDETYAFLNADGAVVPASLERFRDRPDRRRGIYAPATVESFIDYVKKNEIAGTSVWVHPTEGRIRAVIDDHESQYAPGWGQHRAHLDLVPTPEWEFWMARNGELLAQDAFASHIEEGVRQIVNPNAADMLEIAQSFHAATDAKFRSRIVLASGEVRMAYDETIDAQAGKEGHIAIPQEFELAIAPFIGEEPYKVMARFRYRVRGGTLQLGYSLIEPDLVVRDSLQRIHTRLSEEFGESGVFVGEPAHLGAAG
jgi:uncharacterized protein YfdQ (DUF2303 family)